MKHTPTQHEKALQGYSIETLLKLRSDLESAFMAGRLDKWGAERLAACKKVIKQKSQQP